MKAVRSFLNGERKEPLNAEEIKLLAVESSRLNNVTSISRNNAEILVGIKRGAINIDTLLVEIIAQARSNKDFPLIGICIRNGNPNIYVKTKLGLAHLVIYAISKLQDTRSNIAFINTLCSMLIIGGAKLNLYAFEYTEPIISQASSQTAPERPVDMTIQSSLDIPSSSSLLGASTSTSSASTTLSPITTIDLQSIRPLSPFATSPQTINQLSMSPSRSISSSPLQLRIQRGTQSFSTTSSLTTIPSFSTVSSVPTTTVVSSSIPVITSRQTVQDWLSKNGFIHLSDEEKLISRLSKETKINFGIFCDIPELAYLDILSQTPILPSLDTILMSRAIKTGKDYPLSSNSRLLNVERGDYIIMSRCIECGFAELFIYWYDRGIGIEYFSINRLVLELRSTILSKDIVYMEALEEMLMHSIKHGTSMDTEQLTIISTTSSSISGKILAEYRKPAWSKICSPTEVSRVVNTNSVPNSLRELAFKFNVNPWESKESICSLLNTYSQIDPNSLKQAAIRRRQAIVTSSVSSIADYINDIPHNVTCQNQTVLQTDPFDYNDTMVAFYSEGKNTYCFTSDQFENLLKSKMNRYSGTKLPDSFLTEIKVKLDILKGLKIDPTNPFLVSSAVDQLSVNDEISNKESQEIVNIIIRTATGRRISETKIRSLNAKQMNRILNTIGMTQPYMETMEMTNTHQLITFARAAYFVIKDDNGKANIFFNNIALI